MDYLRALFYKGGLFEDAKLCSLAYVVCSWSGLSSNAVKNLPAVQET